MKLELTRRSILVAVVAVGIVAAGAGAGTMALFSSQASSTNNTIQAGTLDLTGAQNGFVMNENLAPTWSTNGTVNLKDSGSLGGQITLNASYASNNTRGSQSAANTSKVLNVSKLSYNGTSIKGEINNSADGNPNDVTLYDLAHTNGLTVGNISAGATHPFNVTLTMQNVGNKYQGAGVDTTFNFTVTQHT